MTNQVTRYREFYSDYERTRGSNMDTAEDGEWVRYDDIKHLLTPEPGPSHIKTWRERCDELHDDMAIVTSSMVQQRMQEEIDDLRASLNRTPPHE